MGGISVWVFAGLLILAGVALLIRGPVLLGIALVLGGIISGIAGVRLLE